MLSLRLNRHHYRGNVQNYDFATGGVTNSPRAIEFRANIDFEKHFRFTC
jgi:hypothetical protein